MAPLGVINVHGSLLPKLRGAAPINWSIINGDTVTGVTTMQTEAGLDTGPMLLKDEIVISEDMTAEDLAKTMSEVGARLLVKTLRQLNDIVPEAQDDSQSTFAPRLGKELSAIDWSKTARQIHDQVRGLTPWPSTTTLFRGQELKIVKTGLWPEADGSPQVKASRAGLLHKTSGGLLVSCGDGRLLQVLEVQPLSRARQEAKNWTNGVRLLDGECFD
jgi:methionyl-tRNA formyltransferase